MISSPITTLFAAQAPEIFKPVWEHNTRGPYQMANDGGVELDVADFLYGLIRMLKPMRVLETGTHKGISSSYIGKALQDNHFGSGLGTTLASFVTLEIFNENKLAAETLWYKLGLDFIECQICPSLNFTPLSTYDFMLLDSEPQLRFAEAERFWPNLEPGGVFVIHDLHPNLGHCEVQNPDHPNEPDWPYGDIRKTFLGRLIRDHQVSVMSFPTPRGITMFQKTHPNFLSTQIAKGIQ